MAKTNLTLEIEKALRYYAPKELGGISINIHRGTATAFEVPVECGTNRAGMVDCVRISEYFGDLMTTQVCSFHSWKMDGIRQVKIDCPRGFTDNDHVPMFCDESKCRWNRRGKSGSPKILIQCFEIKVSLSDFKSKHGHNFVGNLNYYIVPNELYPKVKDLIPEGIGVLVYFDGAGEVKKNSCGYSVFPYCGLRRKTDAKYREMSDEDQKWMILNVLKRIRRE
ncbi:MAG: hypothetical protein LBS36_07655 [Oscillospiraceae bacterium]|nr:hypothetical protein [Oscillospiraceae bacterium]